MDTLRLSTTNKDGERIALRTTYLKLRPYATYRETEARRLTHGIYLNSFQDALDHYHRRCRHIGVTDLNEGREVKWRQSKRFNDDG